MAKIGFRSVWGMQMVLLSGLLATDALALERTFALQADGSVVPVAAPRGAKSLAFCNQNPSALLAWRETVTPSGRVPVAENVGTATQTIQVTLIAKCSPRPSNILFTYGDRQLGSAQLGLDYQSIETRTTAFDGVTQYFEPERPGTPMMFSAQIINDTEQEGDETIVLDIKGLREEFTDPQGGFTESSIGAGFDRFGFTILANDGPNQPPTIVSNGSTTTTGTNPVSVDLAPLVRDPEDDPLTFAIASPPSSTQGTATLSGSTLTFVPVRGFEGRVVIGINVSDGRNPPVRLDVEITVSNNPANRPPVATVPTFAAPESAGGEEVSFNLTPLFSDPDGDALTFDIATPPANGTARVVGTTVFYLPNDGFEGTDQFVVRARDAGGGIATLTITVGVTASLDAGDVEEDLDAALDALPGGGSELARAAVEAVADACGEADDGSNALNTCLALVDAAEVGNGAAVEAALENLAAEEVSAQSSVAVELVSQQKANVAARMAAVRGGSSGFDLAGLSMFAGNGALSLGLLQGLPGLNLAQSEATGATGDVRPSPWGFFVNGSIGGGDRDAGARESGFDFENYGITAGVDYRLNDHAFVGVALGYSASDVELDGDTGDLDTDGLGLTGYASWFGNGGWYADGSLGYFRNDYEQSRVIDLTSIGLTRELALSETDADQLVLTAGVGYEFARNGWLLSPEIRVEYADTDIDGFSENGDNVSGFLLSFPEQSIESLQISAGFQIARAISTASGVAQPFLRVDWFRETDNDGFTLIPRLRSDPSQPFAQILIDDPDRNFGSLSGGVSWVRAGGMQFYFSAFRNFAYEDLDQWALRAGARWEF